MISLASEYPTGLLKTQQPPCLSLYQPTHRHHPDNQQDPIRFRNLIKTMDASLRQQYPKRDFAALLNSFHALADDHEFWNHTHDGLAALADASGFHVFRLQQTVPELAIVADSFHTKPLLRILQSADRYQILGLSRGRIRLFEGTRYALDEIEPAEGVPTTITDALGEEKTEPHMTVASYGSGVRGPAMRHGHGSKKDEVDSDTERFFRAVDRAVLEHHSRPSRLPIMLAALGEYHTPFRRVSHNPFLMTDGVDINPETISVSELRERAWKAVEPHYRAHISKLAEEFAAAKAKEFGSDDLATAAAAAVAGRVGTLLIEANRRIPGRMDATTGRIEFDRADHPGVDDLLDDIGEHVLKMGGQVVVVSGEPVATRTGIAAIYKF